MVCNYNDLPVARIAILPGNAQDMNDYGYGYEYQSFIRTILPLVIVDM